MRNSYQLVANTDFEHEYNIPNASSSHTLLMNQNFNDMSPNSNNNSSDTNITPPPEPPSYEFDIEDSYNDLHKRSHLQRVSIGFQEKILEPLMENIIHPFFQILKFVQDKTDYYLSKIGNPFILRRFFYIILMSFVAYYVFSSGYLFNEKASGLRGMFSQHDILFQYAKKSVDMAKFERDLEYISSMPHGSGTKGDAVINQYIQDSFDNNGLKVVRQMGCLVYSNYPGNVTISYYDNENKKHDLRLSTENFNPLSSNGNLSKVSLIYGGKGTTNDLQKLKNSETIEDGKDYVLLLNYDEIVSQQVLIAEKFGANAVIFISEPYGDNIDVIQSKPVGLPQYSTGDASMPTWFDPDVEEDPKFRRLAHIPTIPISTRQGQELLSRLSSGGIIVDGVSNDHTHSGKMGDLLIDLDLQNNVREKHLVSNIVGKIEGKEQSDKAIIIAASRNSMKFGTTYPNFGTAALLSILQLFQEIKYKFDWKPLRNIYFISFGGSEFNYAGSSSLFEQRLIPLKDEIYSVIDISQLGIPVGETYEDGKTGEGLNIETHPLLKKFFENNDGHLNFDVSVDNVHHYGDWTPFLANGIPVSIISSNSTRNRFPPVETSEDTFEHFEKILESKETQETIKDLLIFLLRITMKLVDDPLLHFDIISYVEDIDERLQKLEQAYPEKLNFTSVIRGLLFWKKIGHEWASWTQGWENIVWSHGDGVEPSLLSINRWTWNKKLTNIGRRTCSPAGLPNRSFYKNILFGPTLIQEDKSNNNGNVDFWTFPGVMDAIYDDDWKRAQEQVDLIGNVLHQSAVLFVEENNDIGYK